MAKAKFGLDFEGFLDLAKQVDELGSTYLKQATNNALEKSKDYANTEIVIAMKSSKYAFVSGKRSGKNRPATGKAMKSVQETAKKPVEWNGTVATAYIGPDLQEAPEALILAMGTPHIKKDTKLYNAIKVKGKVRKAVETIQQKEFQKIIEEAMNNG